MQKYDETENFSSVAFYLIRVIALNSEEIMCLAFRNSLPFRVETSDAAIANRLMPPLNLGFPSLDKAKLSRLTCLHH